MAEMKKVATRDSYGNALKELGAAAANLVVLDADLAGATKTSVFQKAYPQRHFDCGIAEANMIDVAAGLSTMGLVPFAATFAMFAAGRAYEQVRTIPGMTVMCPADDVEARQMVKAAYEMQGPVYMRFGRAATPVFHEESYAFQIGKGEVIQDGADIAIIATGIMVPEAIEAGKALAEAGISARIINMATIKPLDEELVLKAAKECGKIITVEEHSIIGGLGEAVCSVLAENCPVPVKRIGVNDEFGHSGPAAALLKQFGLCADNIAAQAKKMLGK